MENKLLEEINNIERLSADLRYKVNNNILDLEPQLESIENWIKSIRRIIKRVNNK